MIAAKGDARTVLAALLVGGAIWLAPPPAEARAISHTAGENPEAQASGGDCARKRVGRGLSVRMIVRRQGGGFKDGLPYIRFHVHFQTKSYAFPYADRTNLKVVFRNRFDLRDVGKDDTQSKLNSRIDPKRYYGHTTVRAKPGTTIRFYGHVDYFKPGIPLPGNQFLTGDAYKGSCVAR